MKSVISMSENHFSFGAVSPNVAMIKCDGEPLNIGEVVDCLNRMCDEIKEQKTIIEKQKLRLEHLEELLELSENLNDKYKEKLIDINLKNIQVELGIVMGEPKKKIIISLEW